MDTNPVAIILAAIAWTVVMVWGGLWTEFIVWKRLYLQGSYYDD